MQQVQQEAQQQSNPKAQQMLQQYIGVGLAA